MIIFSSSFLFFHIHQVIESLFIFEAILEVKAVMAIKVIQVNLEIMAIRLKITFSLVIKLSFAIDRSLHVYLLVFWIIIVWKFYHYLVLIVLFFFYIFFLHFLFIVIKLYFIIMKILILEIQLHLNNPYFHFILFAFNFFYFLYEITIRNHLKYPDL